MSLSIIILAAGKGTRMKSATTKVMHKLAGKALLEHVVDTAASLRPDSMAVVCGNGAEQLMPLLDGRSIPSAMQYEQLGTGHAVMQAVSVFENSSLLFHWQIFLKALCLLESNYF